MNFNWKQIYKKADKLLVENHIPNSVNKVEKMVVDDTPYCVLVIPAKWDEEVFAQLDKMPNVIYDCGFHSGGMRYKRYFIDMSFAVKRR